MIDRTYAPRWYRCEECQRVLGVVLRDTSRVRRLYVFLRDRTDKDLPAMRSILEEIERRGHAMPPIFRIYDLDQGDVGCGKCGAVHEWRMSKEALEAHLRGKDQVLGKELIKCQTDVSS
jgi:hypothetical protein